jgi:hypothetical protein
MYYAEYTMAGNGFNPQEYADRSVKSTSEWIAKLTIDAEKMGYTYNPTNNTFLPKYDCIQTSPNPGK